jgi:Cd2+/Zn2+-exporting ATPase
MCGDTSKDSWSWAKWLLISVDIIGSLPVFYKAVNSLKNSTIDINVLMFIAIIGASAIEDFLEAVLIILIFSLANIVE